MTTFEHKKYPVAEHKFFYGHVVVAASFAILVVIWAAYYSFGVFFKPLINEFGWTRATTSGAYSLSSIVMGLLAIAMGKLTDRFGPRIVMTICAILLFLGFWLMSKIVTTWQLYVFYGLIIGIGMGGSFVPLMSTVVRWFFKRRSMMTGIAAAGISIGTLIGPPITHRLITNYGWRISYAILGATVFAAVILIAQLLKRDPAEVGQLAYGEINISEKNSSNPLDNVLSFKEAIHTRQFWVVFFMFFCLGFMTFAIIVHLAPHAIELGISAAVAANILATIGGLNMIGRIIMGRVADIIGSKQAFVIGFILMAIALFFLVPSKMIWIIFVLAGLFGFANGTCVASQSPLVALLFGLSSHGVILGFLAFGFTTGGAFGPWLAGLIFDITNSYQFAFLMCAGVSLVGLFLTAFLKPKRIVI
ncbi:MAG: MFS transporter [Desulfobacterales bacterium]|nr:MAG: MFS transporter [Desulfobacterales bacterium]